MKPRDIIVGAVLGVFLTIVVMATAYRMTHTIQRDARAVGLPIPVQTLPAAVRTLRETIGASGTIQPSMPLTMSAKVISRVLAVPVDLGDVVAPGNLLVRLDRRLFEANLEAAKVSYEHAHKQLQRMEALARRNFASTVQVEAARTAEAEAHDAVVRAEIDLSNTTVLSPAPAVVLERAINPGEVTRLDQELIQLGVIDPVMMVAEVSEDKIGSVYLGMQADVGTDAFPGLNFGGSVSKIDSRVDDTTRTFAVYIQLANHSLKLKKGVTGYARLESTRMALTVPSSAIMNPVGDRATVFVVGKDERAHVRQIRAGAVVDGIAELLEGVGEGEPVVTAGQFDLKDDDRINANHFAPWNKQ